MHSARVKAMNSIGSVIAWWCRCISICALLYVSLAGEFHPRMLSVLGKCWAGPLCVVMLCCVGPWKLVDI